MSDLADRLANLTPADTPTRPRPVHPKGWEPGVRYEQSGMLVTTPPSSALDGGEQEWRQQVEAMGLTVPDGYRVRLVEAKHDPAAWHRDTQGDDAVTRPVWRLRFAVEPDPGSVLEDTDLAAIIAEVRKTRRKAPPAREGGGSFVVVAGDLQVGKTGSGGGTEDLIKRVMGRFDRMEQRVR